MTPRKRPPRADEPERTDEHEVLEERRADRRAADLQHEESIARLERSATRTYRFLVAAIGVGGAAVIAIAWIGAKTQGPGARIDALTAVVEHIQIVQTSRDSVIRGQLSIVVNQIGQLRFETCLGTAAGRAPGGALACEIQRAQMTQPTARP